MFGRDQEIHIVIAAEDRSLGAALMPLVLEAGPGPDLRYGGWHDLPKKPRKRWKTSRRKGK